MSEEIQEESNAIPARLLKVARENRLPGGGFWTFNVGHLITVACAIIPTIVIFGKMSERIDGNAKAIGNNSDIILRMDKEGTKASQINFQLDHQMVMSHESRLQRTEDAITSISVMKEQISRISDDIKTIKGRP